MLLSNIFSNRDGRAKNTTFGGIQGFSRRPSTPWYDDQGQFAGIVHQERNWTYVLVAGAGHLVPQDHPARVCSPLLFRIMSHSDLLQHDLSIGPCPPPRIHPRLQYHGARHRHSVRNKRCGRRNNLARRACSSWSSGDLPWLQRDTVHDRVPKRYYRSLEQFPR